MRIVLDTNVLVSGLLNPYGPPGRILDLILAGTAQVVFDDRIMGEYEDVLQRPKFSFDPFQVKVLSDYLRRSGQYVTGPALAGVADVPEPTDLPFAEVAVAGGVNALVTGNQSHFGFFVDSGVQVQTPTDFLARFSAE